MNQRLERLNGAPDQLQEIMRDQMRDQECAQLVQFGDSVGQVTQQFVAKEACFPS
jgi:hypothetical protein